ncbi:MAG: hypothetical protein EOP84_20785 [Verrucomicrobiaceae bacterium]|nr:MAG: hypothetical protein EOP84_20785 [Verrucomicrobiaceae bacterium]
MASNINLDGGEISIIKAIGMTSGEVSGEQLVDLVPDMVGAELLDAMKGLVMMGYVVTDSPSFSKMADFERAKFHVNSGYSRELKEALDPTPEKPKSRRMRRE